MGEFGHPGVVGAPVLWIPSPETATPQIMAALHLSASWKINADLPKDFNSRGEQCVTRVAHGILLSRQYQRRSVDVTVEQGQRPVMGFEMGKVRYCFSVTRPQERAYDC